MEKLKRILFVSEPIEFHFEPLLVGKEGENITVSCGVSTSQVYSIIWTRQRGDIEGNYLNSNECIAEL